MDSEDQTNSISNLSTLAKIEALLFATPTPLKVKDILELIQDESLNEDQVKTYLESLKTEYEQRAGGFSLFTDPGQGYQFQTEREASYLMERLFSSRPRPLSRAAQETLAIIAYRQPVTRADIEFIRGVDAGSIIKNLLEKELVKCVGRKEDSGRPMLFGTTQEFLRVYGLGSLEDLPPLESFQPSHDTFEKTLKKVGVGETEQEDQDFLLAMSQNTVKQ